MSDSSKLSVKLGNAEFTAEGGADLIRDQFALFLEALKTQPAAPAPAGSDAAQDEAATVEERVESTAPQNGAQLFTPAPNGTVPLDRVFKFDHRGGVVSLIHLPTTTNANADAIVMLLYGFAQLAHATSVGTIPLMKGAKQSGLNLERIDRVLGPNAQYVTRGGTRRGTRYGLNNRGEQYAQELIRGMLA